MSFLRGLCVLPMSAAVRRWAARRRGKNHSWIITTPQSLYSQNEKEYDWRLRQSVTQPRCTVKITDLTDKESIWTIFANFCRS